MGLPHKSKHLYQLLIVYVCSPVLMSCLCCIPVCLLLWCLTLYFWT